MRGANPVTVLVLGYLLVTVGYVYGTIMLIVVLLACLVDAWLARDRTAALKVLGVGALLGLVAVTVYLPGVLTSSVTARSQEFRFGGKFTTSPLALFAGVLPTSSVPGTSEHLEPYAYLVWFLPVVAWLDWRRFRAGWRPDRGPARLLPRHPGDRRRAGSVRARCAGRCGSSRSWSRPWSWWWR